MKKPIILLIILTIIFTVNKNCLAQCSYDNSQWLTWSAPTIVGDSVSSFCTYAGEYNTVTGMVAGNTYQIYTCTNNAFDTQISIYPSGGGLPSAYNDDFCGAQSFIFFTPITSGSYDILIDEYPCIHDTICMDLIVKLVMTPRPVITIPVVFHVVYNDLVQNISNAQIQSQIDVLNEDFRRLNADIINAPAVFSGASYDPLVEFCLAQRDSAGFTTNGITRTYTNVTEFISNNFLSVCDSNECIYLGDYGGHDPWDKTQYLNIWVGNITGSNFPFGTHGTALPLSPLLPSIHQGLGIALDYRAVGTIGTATSPTNKGRTGTHEAGHWLGLWHNWGLNTLSNSCASDSVFDTPPQDEPSSGCPPFPFTDYCSILPSQGGIMFTNFMDYSDDACKNMFTIGQVARMDAMLHNQYLSFQTSLGCLPVAPSWNCISPGNCQDPGNGTGAYASLSACQTACVVTPTWDCISPGNCQDPGTGNGAYASLSSCQSSCIAPPVVSFDCDGQGNCNDPGTGNGAYASLSSCQSSCIAPPVVSFDCDGQGNCSDPGTGNGSYASLSSCQSSCIAPPAVSFDCDGQGNCNDPGTGNGFYSTLLSCEVECIQTSVNIEGVGSLVIYPNPTNGYFTVKFSSLITQDLKVKITNAIGEIIFIDNSENFIGEYKSRINLKDYAEGIYFLEIETNKGTANKKIILY